MLFFSIEHNRKRVSFLSSLYFSFASEDVRTWGGRRGEDRIEEQLERSYLSKGFTTVSP